jgi:3-oxo-4-pregnene-20-carboxyl-CoA dehydrogenase alpha subunit
VDFTPDPEQQAVADVVDSVLDRENSWAALVSGGVTALGVPERLGGDGGGLPEIATALTGIGRHGTISPACATLGFGLVPLIDLADDAQQDRFLDGVARGALLTAALNEQGSALPDAPATILADGRINGLKVAVPYAAQAAWMLVSTDSGVVVVSPKAEGVRLTATPTSAGGEECVVEFSDVAVDPADVLAGATARRLNQLVLALTGAHAAGLVAGALRLTADYVAQRHQFGRPLSTFQTVAAQLAEVYIASRTLDLISTSAVWRLAEGLDADDDLAVLGYWLTSQAPPMMQICHHLHGGMGMDVTYPMHRYYSSIKDLTRFLGGPAHRLDLVAIASAAEPGAAGRHRESVAIASAAEPGAAGRHQESASNSVGAQCISN